MPFTSKTFRFFAELESNNDKTWFHANKDRYEEHVRTPALEFVEAMLPKLPGDYFGEPKKQGGALSQPHRDIRFSADKTPYNTHIGIRFKHRQGTRAEPGPGYYLHVARKGSFWGAGIHLPQGDTIRAIRNAIAADPKGWRAATKHVTFGEYELLKRAPKGFPEDHPAIEELRRKDFTCWVQLSQKDLCDARLADRLAKETKKMEPMCRFLADAVF